jgi:stage II sporulation protein M
MMMIGLEPVSAPGTKPPLPKRLSDLVRELYRDEWAMWRAHYRRYFKVAARALALGFILGFVYFMIWPAQEKTALDFVMKSLKDIPLGAPPVVLALTLFYHNARAAVLAVAAGAIPFACLPVLDPVANGVTLGLLASISKHQGLNVPLLFLKSVAPHGIFELPAVLYATSVGIHLSVSLAKKVKDKFRKRKESRNVGARAASAAPDSVSFLESYSESVAADTGGIVGDIVRSFVVVVLPLLFVAAFVESFITPLLR